MKISFGEIVGRFGTKLRVCFLALAIFAAVLQPQPAQAQLGGVVSDPGEYAKEAVQWALESAQWIIQNIITATGNILQGIIGLIQSMASDIRATFINDGNRQNTENQLQANKVSDATPAQTDTGCAVVLFKYQRAGAAAATRGFTSAVNLQVVNNDKGKNGRGGTPAVSAEKDCALGPFLNPNVYGSTVVQQLQQKCQGSQQSP